MTAHRFFNWCMAFAIVALYAVVAHLDGPDDLTTAQAIAADATEAQHRLDAPLRRDLAAAKLCREQHGEASFTWNSKDQLVCIPRRGKGTIQLAQVQ